MAAAWASRRNRWTNPSSEAYWGPRTLMATVRFSTVSVPWYTWAMPHDQHSVPDVTTADAPTWLQQSGALVEVLKRLADHFERFAEVQSKFISALIYPCIVACVGVVIGWILGSRAARDAYAAELRRREERAAAKAGKA